MNHRLSMAALACAAVLLFPGCDLFEGSSSDLFEEPSSSQINDLEDVYNCDVEAIDDGSVSGTLDADDDCVGGDEFVVDHYAFQLEERAEVEIEMEADNFDTYLLLDDDDGENITFDDGEDDSDARIVRTLSPGTYVIRATTLMAGEDGSYSLRLSGDEDDGDDEDDLN